MESRAIPGVSEPIRGPGRSRLSAPPGDRILPACLSLGPGQRFASKGGYVVRFADATGTRVVPEGEWTVP